ncbi:uncharacterized protein RAG0_13364 [Rhynchosporium agropyri]|uniref:Uncharacterized protein n=1 Tax=Rhynchosporium agropyri TaxID=914238 RepID=A0A1E1LCF5_9HELO|nr:uncharacterized protein RAG0_13364 [Rhynchosporium agropyri]
MARTISSSGEPAALRGQTPSPSPRSATTSLQAAAAMNAGLQQEGSRRSSSGSITRTRQSSHAGRRRSTVLMNLQLHDPALPSPGEMVNDHHASSHRTSSPHSLTNSPIITSGDPHHYRAASLGEIHQEIEQEQEAQVNRLLQMIRIQQQELQQLQAIRGSPENTHPTPAVIDETTPTSERSLSFSTPNVRHSTMSTPRSPTAIHPRSSFDIARADLQHRQSRTSSRTASPRMRSTSISGEGGESWNLGGRDESAFYQAETQMMVRENQMLRQRIRELERQASELNTNSSVTHEPAIASHLLRSQSVSDEGPHQIPATTAANISATVGVEIKND